MNTNRTQRLDTLLEAAPSSGLVRWIQTSFLLLALMAILGHGTQASATNLILNYDFETLSATAGNSNSTMTAAGGYICAKNGAACTSNLASWASTCKGTAPNLSCGTGGTVASILYAGTNGSAFNGGIGLYAPVANSPTGGKFIAIDGDSAYSASISQSISGLTVGGAYVLRFWQAAAQQQGTVGATTEWWDVTFGAQRFNRTGTLGKMNNPSGGFTGWNQVSYTFTATTTTQTLRFLAKSDNNNMGLPPVVLLDGLSLEAQVPEPGTFVLLGGGLLAMAAMAKKKRK